MKKIYPIIFAIAFFAQSCENKTGKTIEKSSLKEDSITVKTKEIRKDLSEKSNKHSIRVIQIDSIQYHLQLETANYQNTEIKKITCF